MSKIPFCFETIDKYHKRAKVFGGWIFKTYEEKAHVSKVGALVKGHDYAVTTTFIPDPDHKWEITDKKDIRDVIYRALRTYETKNTARANMNPIPLMDLIMHGGSNTSPAVESELKGIASFIKYVLSTKEFI